MEQQEIDEIVANHVKWLQYEACGKRTGKRADFQGADFECIDLRNVDLSGANFQGARIRKTDFRNVKFGDADFRHASLWGNDFRYADFEDADLRHVDLDGADLRYTRFKHCDFTSAILRDTNLRNADLTESVFAYADLGNADLEGIEGYGSGYTSILQEVCRQQDADFFTPHEWKAIACICFNRLTFGEMFTQFLRPARRVFKKLSEVGFSEWKNGLSPQHIAYMGWKKGGAETR